MCTEHKNVPTTIPAVEARPTAAVALSAGGPAVSRAAAEAVSTVRAALGAPAHVPVVEARPAPASAPVQSGAPVAPAVQAPRAEVARLTTAIVAEAATPAAPAAPEVAPERRIMVDIQRHQRGFVARQSVPVLMKGGHRIRLRLVGGQVEVTFLEVKGNLTDQALTAAVQAWINERAK